MTDFRDWRCSHVPLPGAEVLWAPRHSTSRLEATTTGVSAMEWKIISLSLSAHAEPVA